MADLHAVEINIKEIVLKLVSENPFELENVAEEFKKDKDVVLVAVRGNGLALQFAHADLTKDEQVVMTAVMQNGRALQYADESFKDDTDIVLIAVEQNGAALKYAGKEVRKDKEVVLAAVTEYGRALKHADETLQNDKEIVLSAVMQYGLALKYASEELRNDREVALVAISQNPSVLKYVGEKLKEDEDFLTEMVLLGISTSENVVTIDVRNRQILEQLRFLARGEEIPEGLGKRITKKDMLEVMGTYEGALTIVAIDPDSIKYVPEELVEKHPEITEAAQRTYELETKLGLETPEEEKPLETRIDETLEQIAVADAELGDNEQELAELDIESGETKQVENVSESPVYQHILYMITKGKKGKRSVDLPPEEITAGYENVEIAWMIRKEAPLMYEQFVTPEVKARVKVTEEVGRGEH